MRFSKWIPKKTKRLVKGVIGRGRPPGDLKTSMKFEHLGPQGPLLTKVFARIKDIPGAFNVDDTAHFHLVLAMQTHFGFHGDLLEIGSSHGRSTAAMVHGLEEEQGEQIHVCDAFERDTEDRYASKPSVCELINNLRKVKPGLREMSVVIHDCLSNELVLPGNQRFRFIHIDGGHSRDQTLFDLNLCKKHLQPKGIMVVDDYCHPDWPGVKEAVDAFLEENPDFSILADLNRHGAKGRKIYLHGNARNQQAI